MNRLVPRVLPALGLTHDRTITAACRWRLTLWLLVAGFVAAFALAPGLWFSGSPLVPLPVIAGLRGLPAPFDLALLIVLGVSLPVMALLPRPQRWLLAWAGAFALRAVWDIALWQPYFIEYLGILVALAFVGGWRDGAAPREEHAERAFALARLVVIASYLWPGLAKLDQRFITSVAPATLEPMLTSLGLTAPSWLGFTIPATEIAISLLLLSRRFRLFGVLGAIVTHGIIVWSIGPFGLDAQQIVWPWNLVLPGLVVALFVFGPIPPWKETLRPRDPGLLLVLGFFFVVPALSYVVPVEPYLALRVYSSKIHEAFLQLPESVVAALPEGSRAAVRVVGAKGTGGDARLKVRIANWSEEELGGYLSPSASTYRTVAQRMCALARDEDDVRLILIDPPDWLTGEARIHRLGCDELR